MPRNSTAEIWCQKWGENLRERTLASLGGGIGEGGRYRPEDDPHPSSWVVAQVDMVLQSATPREKRLAYVVYVAQRGVWSLRHEFGSHKIARGVQKTLLEAVDRAVVKMKERTIAEAHAKQMVEAGIFDSEQWKAVIEYCSARDGIRYPIKEEDWQGLAYAPA